MMTRRLAVSWIALLSAAPLGAQAPSQVPHQLSLAQALDLARQNNPTYLQAQTNEAPAAEAVKQANWAVFPTISANTGVGYIGAGSQTFGNTVFATSPTVSSNYGFNAQLQLGTRVFLTPSIAKAQQQSTEFNVAAAGVTLTSTVTAAYLNVLRADATVNVALQQIASDTAQLTNARVKMQIGSASQLDVLTAQTQLATARVQLINAQQTETQAKITLVQDIGLPADANVDSLTLTEPYPLVKPDFDLHALLAMAHTGSPGIQALQAQDRANEISVKAARYDRLPTLSLTAGLSGYTQQFTNTNILIQQQLSNAQASEANCEFQNQILEGLTTPIAGGIIPDCKAYAGLDATGNALQPAIVQSIRTSNSVFPFSFTRNPLQLSISLSVPLWDSYTRSLRISQAEATADAGHEQLRNQQLATDAQIQTQLATVTAAWQRIQIQDTNRVAAQEQLRYAQEKYRLGSASALDVATAETTATQSEADYVTAVYDYHLAVVALEAAVGHPLR